MPATVIEFEELRGGEAPEIVSPGFCCQTQERGLASWNHRPGRDAMIRPLTYSLRPSP
jgi:hypothetical protein